MIHPAEGGCDVYISLANKLSEKYNCIGIDNYNLHNKNKIIGLNNLATYYLEQIEIFLAKSSFKEYNILGWSLGGNIALEIASILENQRNSLNKKIYLLDSIISDETLRELRNKLFENGFSEKTRNRFLSLNKDYEYVNRIIENLENDKEMFFSKITSYLTSTKVILFKALQKDNILEASELNEIKHKHMETLLNNNLNLCMDISNLRIINLENCHHINILSQEELIIKNM